MTATHATLIAWRSFHVAQRDIADRAGASTLAVRESLERAAARGLLQIVREALRGNSAFRYVYEFRPALAQLSVRRDAAANANVVDLAERREQLLRRRAGRRGSDGGPRAA
jgi:hypothetical protein